MLIKKTCSLTLETHFRQIYINEWE